MKEMKKWQSSDQNSIGLHINRLSAYMQITVCNSSHFQFTVYNFAPLTVLANKRKIIHTTLYMIVHY